MALIKKKHFMWIYSLHVKVFQNVHGEVFRIKPGLCLGSFASYPALCYHTSWEATDYDPNACVSTTHTEDPNRIPDFQIRQ